jgi:pseudouridine-5'-phosphate glycosidase
VPVIGYGTDEMPAFFSRQSGLGVDVRLDSPAEVAAVIRARRGLGLASGILVTAPVPPGDEFDAEAAESAIRQATAEADAGAIHGPAATPWLLRRVAELTNAQSTRANVALLRNNGRLAGQIAACLAGNP